MKDGAIKHIIMLFGILFAGVVNTNLALQLYEKLNEDFFG